MANSTKAERIVDAILHNLDDRSGIDFGQIDLETMREMRETLAEIVERELSR